MKAYIEENGTICFTLTVKKGAKPLLICFAENIERIRKSLENYGVVFDVWFSEQSLYDNGEVRETLDILKEKGYTFEKDGAVWFKASAWERKKMR